MNKPQVREVIIDNLKMVNKAGHDYYDSLFVDR